MTINERIARLRALAVSILAEKRLGVDLSPGEAIALADANSINDALILLERRIERKPFAYPPITNKPGIVSGPHPATKTRTQIDGEQPTVPLRPDSRYRYPSQTKPAGDRRSVPIVSVAVLSITGIWSYLVGAIAVQLSLTSDGDIPKVAASLVLAGVALVLGLCSATLLYRCAGTVALRHRWSLHFLIGLAGLLVFVVARFGDQVGAFRLDVLTHWYSLLTWVGVTLLTFGTLRQTNVPEKGPGQDHRR